MVRTTRYICDISRCAIVVRVFAYLNPVVENRNGFQVAVMRKCDMMAIYTHSDAPQWGRTLN